MCQFRREVSFFLVVWAWRGCKTEGQVPLIGNLPPWTWVGSRQGVLCWCPMKRKGGASTHVVQRPPWSPRFTQVGGGVKRYWTGAAGYCLLWWSRPPPAVRSYATLYFFWVLIYIAQMGELKNHFGDFFQEQNMGLPFPQQCSFSSLWLVFGPERCINEGDWNRHPAPRLFQCLPRWPPASS